MVCLCNDQYRDKTEATDADANTSPSVLPFPPTCGQIKCERRATARLVATRPRAPHASPPSPQARPRSAHRYIPMVQWFTHTKHFLHDFPQRPRHTVLSCPPRGDTQAYALRVCPDVEVPRAGMASPVAPPRPAPPAARRCALRPLPALSAAADTTRSAHPLSGVACYRWPPPTAAHRLSPSAASPIARRLHSLPRPPAPFARRSWPGPSLPPAIYA